jgi:hypothetical protein
VKSQADKGCIVYTKQGFQEYCMITSLSMKARVHMIPNHVTYLRKMTGGTTAW